MAISKPVDAAKQAPLLNKLYVQVLIAFGAGVALGAFQPDFAAGLKLLGDAFISLVNTIIAPVIFLTVVTGLGAMGADRKLGSTIGKARAYYLVWTDL